MDPDQGQRALESGAQCPPRRRSALSPAGPPLGKRTRRRAEPPSPATRQVLTARKEVGRVVAAQLPLVIMARARPRGRWLRIRCPQPPAGPGSPPGPAACTAPASQPEDAGTRRPARPAPRCGAPAPPPARNAGRRRGPHQPPRRGAAVQACAVWGEIHTLCGMSCFLVNSAI